MKNEPELAPFFCPDCKKHIIDTLISAKVRCPICGQFIVYNDKNEQSVEKYEAEPVELHFKPVHAKPFYQCKRCGITFRASSNRQKYCDKCKQSIRREQKRTWIKNHRKNSPGSPLEVV